MFINVLRSVFAGVTLLCAVQAAHADRLVLKNGDVLTGTVLHKSGDSLSFSTPYAGVISVSWAAVRTLTTDKAVNVMLNDATDYDGRLDAMGDGRAVLTLSKDPVTGAADEEHEGEPTLAQEEAAPRAELDLAKVLYINPTPEESGEGYRITGRANVAYSNASGNTENEQLHGNAEMVLRAKMYRYVLGGEATRASDNGNVSAHNARLYTNYDWFFRPKQFAYAAASVERDRFKDIHLRSVVGGGYGYQWIETDVTKLSLRGGLDYVTIDHYDAENEHFAALGWKLDFSHKLLFVPVEIFHNQDGYRGLNSEGAVVLRTRTGVRVPLSYGFNATAQINLDWESDPAPDREELDRTVLLGLGYEFK
ncbi:MAG TPA: DUF481 domain-containing protein [Burkholderiales bacterium]|nr:DUF481 domain-containing protein [Burkholderiales bacterium]